MARRISDIFLTKYEKNEYNCNLSIDTCLCQCKANGGTDGRQAVDDASRLYGICCMQFDKNEDYVC